MIARAALSVVFVAALAGSAAATPPEPTGAHPRLFLDDDLRATWKKQAGDKASAVHKAIAKCDDIRARPEEYKRDGYMGLDWSRDVLVCLIAWVATDRQQYADTAIVYFTALLDDLTDVGDGLGGDAAAQRDAGYSIRALGPATAIAYDWLHDAPGMTADLRAGARQRFDAWTRWYDKSGYHAHDPGTNYQAGWLYAATLIAIAQGGEAGDDGAHLWKVVADTLWGKDMAAGLAPGGILDGGDWPEGWEYGPLSVAAYAAAARAATAAGIAIDGIPAWLEAVLQHAMHGLTPGNRFFSAGDTQEEGANIEVPYLAFAAPLIGDATPEVQSWAKSQIRELGLVDDRWPFFAALAEARPVEAVPPPLASWPTAYLAAGSHNFYARTRWSPTAVWMFTRCRPHLEADHVPPDSGNVVMSRGADDVLIDPSPYGSMSSLTSNAPTVLSGLYPEAYRPSQSFWSVDTRFGWTRQTASGIVASRCDYADQYRFQETESDVAVALRDLILVPYAGGESAALVVIDRARSGDAARPLHLRFRTQAKLALDGDVASGRLGGTQLTIRRVASSSGAPAVRAVARGNCYGPEDTRGGCDDPRLDIHEYRLTVDGPAMTAIHVLDAAAPGKTPPTVTPLADVDGIVLTRDGRLAVVVAADSEDVTYSAPRADAVHHVIVGALAENGTTTVTASASGDTCNVSLRAAATGPRINALPVIVHLDATCTITDDPSLVEASQSTLAGPSNRRRRSGCCGAQAAPDSPVFLSALVLAALFVLRRRRR